MIKRESAKAFYERIRSRTGVSDYDGLSQSRRTTEIRHKSAIEHLKRAGTLVDLGCGTGLILDAMFQERALPLLYVGVDICPDVAPKVIERLRMYKLHGWVSIVDELVPLTMVPFALDTYGPESLLYVSCIGIFGTGQYRDLNEIQGELYRLSLNTRRGYATVPLQFRDQKEESHLTRFPEEAVFEMAENLKLKFQKNGFWEAAILWGG